MTNNHLVNIFIWTVYTLTTIFFIIGAVQGTKEAMKELREHEELKSKRKESQSVN